VATEERPTAPRNLLARYHADLICALPEEEVEKVRIRLGANLLQPFIDSLDGTPLSAPEVKQRLEAYLRDELGMADYIKVTAEGKEVSVEIKGCHLCFGNDLLRARGKQGCCPFAPGINRALSRALQGGSRLQGVAKAPGKTGECVIKYSAGG
jgi:hypothetical protein